MVAYGQAVVIPPSGDTSGVTDVKVINNVLAAGRPVALTAAPLSAPYWISSPILPVSQSRIWGAQWWSAVNQDNYSAGIGASGGTVIQMTGSFTGAAGIWLANETASQYYGVDLAGFTLEGFSTSGRNCYGILVDGAWGACFLRGVCIHRPDLDCIRFQTSGGGKIPDDWSVSQCKFSASRNGYGVFTQDLPDSWFTDCESSENTLDNWSLGYGTNTRLTGCKGENGAAGGFRFTGNGAGETYELANCTTNLNAHDGFLFDNSAGNGGLATYLLTGCRSSNDGQAGGTTYAGFRAAGGLGRVVGTGCVVIKNGTGPAYGAYAGGSSYGMCLTGSLLQGVTAASHDDGTNTNVLVAQSGVPF